MSDYTGFGLVIGFIDNLEIVTTSNYSAIANSHIAVHYITYVFSVSFTSRFLVTDPSNVLCLRPCQLTNVRNMKVMIMKFPYWSAWQQLRNRPWRPIGLWDVEATTFSRQSAHRWRWGQPYALPPLPPLLSGRLLVLISVRGWINPRAIVRLHNWLNSKLVQLITPRDGLRRKRFSLL
jgi:hypothetical protein